METNAEPKLSLYIQRWQNWQDFLCCNDVFLIKPFFPFSVTSFQNMFSFKKKFQSENLFHPFNMSSAFLSILFTKKKKDSLVLLACWKRENRSQLSSCRAHWNIAHLSALKISCQDGERHLSKDHIYVKSCVCFQFHVGATFFTVPRHAKKIMNFSPCVCKLLRHSASVSPTPAAVDALGLRPRHIRFPRGSITTYALLIIEDYEFLML